MAAITERSATELAGAIRRRELSAVEVVEAHIALLSRAGARVNALAADRFAAARAEAAAADRRVADAGPDERLPPLLGVPFTVKESIALGRDAAVGGSRRAARGAGDSRRHRPSRG